MYSSSYQAGRITGQLVVLVLIIAGIVWVVRAVRGRSTPAGAVRTPAGDMASLTTVVTLHMAHDAAAALVARVLAAHPQLVPVPGPVPAWSVGGGHPYLTVVQSPAGAVLRVQEVQLPLASPETAVAWEWVIGSVEQEARRVGVATVRAQQRLAQSRPAGPAGAIWAAVD